MGLFGPIWKTGKPGKALRAIEAVNKIVDQAQLARIAREAPLEDVRLAAVARMNDEELLMRAAIEALHAEVSLAAVNKIADQDRLMRIAKGASGSATITAAIRRMNDQALIASLVRESTRDDVQKAALEEIADQFVLAELVLDDPIPHGVSDYRVGALNRIGDPDVLMRVALSSSRYSDRAWRTILKGAEGAQSLTALVLDEGIGDERRASALLELGVRCASKVISEDELRAALVTVATSSAPDTVRLAAVDELVVKNHGWKSDEVDAVLARFALTDPVVCETAAQGILSEDALRKYVFDDFDGPAIAADPKMNIREKAALFGAVANAACRLREDRDRVIALFEERALKDANGHDFSGPVVVSVKKAKLNELEGISSYRELGWIRCESCDSFVRYDWNAGKLSCRCAKPDRTSWKPVPEGEDVDFDSIINMFLYICPTCFGLRRKPSYRGVEWHDCSCSLDSKLDNRAVIVRIYRSS